MPELGSGIPPHSIRRTGRWHFPVFVFVFSFSLPVNDLGGWCGNSRVGSPFSWPSASRGAGESELAVPPPSLGLNTFLVSPSSIHWVIDIDATQPLLACRS